MQAYVDMYGKTRYRWDGDKEVLDVVLIEIYQDKAPRCSFKRVNTVGFYYRNDKKRFINRDLMLSTWFGSTIHSESEILPGAKYGDTIYGTRWSYEYIGRYEDVKRTVLDEDDTITELIPLYCIDNLKRPRMVKRAMFMYAKRAKKRLHN